MAASQASSGGLFLSFFYLLRGSALRTSLNEWLALLSALEAGLHNASLTGFYALCQMLLVKDETQYDLLDQLFLDFFGQGAAAEIPDRFLRWLERPQLSPEEANQLAASTGLSHAEIEAMFRQRLQQQKEEHHGGSTWIGTGGYTAFGNAGNAPGGIRLGGESRYRSAYQVAGERNYRDWRTDATLDPRQFQLALRSLRQLSRNAGQQERELDVEGTIRQTCDQGGLLRVAYAPPRKNAMKLLVLMDSGGSMEDHSRLCSLLFQAVSKNNRFQDLKIYYFHNCIYSNLFKHPSIQQSSAVRTEWVLRNTSPDYRVILVGDAEMDLEEMLAKGPSVDGKPPMSGFDRLMQFRSRYPHLVWFHPQATPEENAFWGQSFAYLKRHFPMYHLSVDGLRQGIRHLLSTPSQTP